MTFHTPNPDRIGVLHLIDSLQVGGAERVAVNLANQQACRGYRVTLCATRQSGPLQREISPEVRFLHLHRKFRFDPNAIGKLLRYINENEVQVIHAHSSSVFIAALVKRLHPRIKVIWHEHHGGLPAAKRSVFLYRPVVQNVDGIIAVNHELAEWSAAQLGVPRSKIRYIPNFVADARKGLPCNLPGIKGFRIICIANLRPQKDHLTVVQAMKSVTAQEARAHLILVGSDKDRETSERIWKEISMLELESSITWLGSRDDVQDILACCDIGVIGSKSEGLPLALLEYGLTGLAVVSTSVGECPAVLDSGKVGKLVPPGSPERLAESILDYLKNPGERASMAIAFHDRILRDFSPDVVLMQIDEIYDFALKE